MRRRTRLLSKAFVATVALGQVVMLAGEASAAVVVTDDPAFAVTVDGPESVVVDCPANKVRVTVDGVPTTYKTRCEDVTSLSVTATGAFANLLSLGGVLATDFTSLTASTADGGGGRDELIGSQLGDQLFGGGGRDALFGQEGPDVLNGGAGTDRCEGGPGADSRVNCER